MKVVKYTSSWVEIKLTTIAAIDTDVIGYCDHDDPLRKKEKFQTTKGVMRSRVDRWGTTQMNMDKRTNNDQQNTTQKTKDCETRTPLKTGVNSGAPEMVSTSYSTSGTRCLTLLTNPKIGHE